MTKKPKLSRRVRALIDRLEPPELTRLEREAVAITLRWAQRRATVRLPVLMPPEWHADIREAIKYLERET